MPQTPIPSLQFHRTKQAVGLERERERERERDRRCAGCRPAGRVSGQPISFSSRRGTQISSSFSSCNSEPKQLLFELQSAIKQLLSELQFDIDAAPHRALIRFRPPFCVDHGRGSSPSRVQSARCSRRRKRSQYKLASRPDRKPADLRRDQPFPSQVHGRLPSPATGGRQFLSDLGRSTRSHGERKSRRYAQQLA